MSALAQDLAADGVELQEAAGVPLALPRDEDELVATLQRASRAGARVVPVGGRAHLAWCRPEVAAGAVDLLLSTVRLAAVREYVAGDGTLTAQAGCTLAALADHVAAGGHRLTPVVAAPERATLGGVLAAGLSGPDRTRLGPARHHVLGVRVAHVDGRVSRSGGKLVKNVTGFDLHRLYAGSRGTLVVLLEASLRLFPEPERVASLCGRAGAGEPLLACADALRLAPTTPLALALFGAPGQWELEVVLAGRAAQVDDDLRRVGEVLRAAGVAAEAREHATARAALEPLAEREGTPEHWPQAAVQGRPAVLAALARELAPGAQDERVALHPAVGTLTLSAPALADAPPDAQLARLTDWRARAARHGARLQPLRVHADVHRALAARPGDRPELRWMEALRATLDPAGTLRCPTFPCAP